MAVSDDVYSALMQANKRIGANEYQRQVNEHLRRGRKKSTFRFSVPAEMDVIISVLRDENATDEQAMDLLHNPDVLAKRVSSIH